MPDVYATIQQQSREIVETIARTMEVRAVSPQQRRMLESYLSHVQFPDEAHAYWRLDAVPVQLRRYWLDGQASDGLWA